MWVYMYRCYHLPVTTRSLTSTTALEVSFYREHYRWWSMIIRCFGRFLDILIYTDAAGFSLFSLDGFIDGNARDTAPPPLYFLASAWDGYLTLIFMPIALELLIDFCHCRRAAFIFMHLLDIAPIMRLFLATAVVPAGRYREDWKYAIGRYLNYAAPPPLLFQEIKMTTSLYVYWWYVKMEHRWFDIKKLLQTQNAG